MIGLGDRLSYTLTWAQNLGEKNSRFRRKVGLGIVGLRGGHCTTWEKWKDIKDCAMVEAMIEILDEIRSIDDRAGRSADN